MTNDNKSLNPVMMEPDPYRHTSDGKPSDVLENQVRVIASQVEYGFDPIDDDESEGNPIMDWLEGVLDFQWIVASDKQTLLGARLLVAFGGPNIWVDTTRGTVEGYWWMDIAFANFRTDSENAQEIREYLQMIWDC